MRPTKYLLCAFVALFMAQTPAMAEVTRVKAGGAVYDYYKPHPNDQLSQIEKQVYALLMKARKARGLPSIPLSASLTLVAGRHAEDFTQNIAPLGGPTPGTNAHSWSDKPYRANHRSPKAMWKAPKRLGTPYSKNAYEIIAWGYTSPEKAVAALLASASHRKVIMNEGMWRKKRWKSVGVGFARAQVSGQYRTYWAVWFGDAKDPAGKPSME